MSTSPQTIYTREDLKRLKVEYDKKMREKYIDGIVKIVSEGILYDAEQKNNTSFFYQTRINIDDPTYDSRKVANVEIEAIEKLKTRFIDVAFEYKFEIDTNTGREFNHGINIDWS